MKKLLVAMLIGLCVAGCAAKVDIDEGHHGRHHCIRTPGALHCR